MTKAKSFLRQQIPRRISRAISALIFILGGLLGASQPARADSAPDWFRSAAQEKLPEYPKDTERVVLLDEVITTVKENGEIEERVRRVFKLLRPQAQNNLGAVSVSFDGDTKLTYLKAWTITGDGTAYEVKETDAVESSFTTFELYNGVRVKTLRYTEAKPGNIVGYEYVRKKRPYVFDAVWRFQELVPVHRSRFYLQLPNGWDFTVAWANHDELKPVDQSSNRYVWEVLEIPAIEVEPAMPPIAAIQGRMYIKFYPRDPKMRGKSSGSWKDLGLWYSGLTGDSRTATPQIKQKVAELTSNLSEPLEKLNALATYVQQQIRYVAIEVGIGGFQPHFANDILTHQYGDCKDKATLLSAMLREIGIESYYVLINTHRGTVSPDFPTTNFNHAILAIRLPDEMSDNALYAEMKDPHLGRLVFFDPTNTAVPLGYLPTYLQENYGLVVSADGGTLALLPLLPPNLNRLLRTGKLNLSADGTLDGSIQEIRWGGPAEVSRMQLQGLPPAERMKTVEQFLGLFLTNFTLTNASVENMEKRDDTLTIRYSFVVEGYAKSAGNLLIVKPRIVGEKGSSILSGKPRKYPIEFPQAARHDDIFDITLPAGYVVDDLPKPVSAECPYATYKSEVKVEGNILHYKRMYEVRELMVPVPKLEEVRTFFHQIAMDERASAVLRRVNP
ncbi:MAG: DUF3857 domain-containing transglutaminase family protein [Candidatus Acidiferrales bacterium]